jgi:hypothetical protein
MLVQAMRPLALLFIGLVVASCSKSSSETPVLQASDLVASDSGFDPNEIVDLGSFTDTEALDATAVGEFLSRTPYGYPSFLATYDSNGVAAADAIATAAAKYTLNPLVFLTRAEMDQGLVGASSYPSTPSRVEYVFGCGCDGEGNCDPNYAGFDVQVDCLGASLRDDLDAITTNGQTAGGWAPMVSLTSVDGFAVIPQDASTAALYQYTPVVAAGQAGGNWLFWNIWQNYAGAIGYAGPVGTMPGGAWIGDPCTAGAMCGYEGGACATNYPDGLCTAECTGSCPQENGEALAFCASYNSAGYCLPVCNTSVPASCRTGYSCKSVEQFNDATMTANVCVPN